MPKVSVIVPIYNSEKTIDRCLNSLLRQTLQDFEVILINDGSKDNSEQICRKFEKLDNRFLVISQKNSGPATARNLGIACAKGDYLAFVDSDDYAEDNMLEKMYLSSIENQADMVICNYFEDRKDYSHKHVYRYAEGLYTGEECKDIAIDLIDDMSEGRIPPYSWVRMIRRGVFSETNLRYTPGMVRSEDYYLFVKVHFSISRLVILANDHLYHYVEDLSSITHSYVPNYWNSVINIYNGLCDELPNDILIQQKLNNMFIRRCQIALNNSRRADKNASNEIGEILKSDLLRNVISKIKFSNGYSLFGPFFILMKFRALELVKIYYLLK